MLEDIATDNAVQRSIGEFIECCKSLLLDQKFTGLWKEEIELRDGKIAGVACGVSR